MERPRPVVPVAKWGAACAPCSAAKSRCIRSSKDPLAKCDRCLSLQRDCPQQIHKPRKKRVTKSKPAETSKKFENLSGLLQLPERPSPSLRTPEPSDSDPSRDHGQSQQASANTSPADQFREDCEASHRLRRMQTFNSGTPRTCVCNPNYLDYDVRPPESDSALLAIYRNQICQWFPFVIIPSDTTAEELKQTRPFLWKAISMVSSLRDLPSLTLQSFDVAEYFAEATMIRSERSLDLLQGMLVCIGYYQYLCLLHVQFNNMMLLSMGMLAEMGLLRNTLYIDKARTNEERRVILGIWYMSSHTAMTFYKFEPMRYTKYIDQTLKELQQEPTYDSDGLVVELVRIQHLALRIHRLNCRDDEVDELPGVPVVPADIIRAATQIELDRMQASLPEYYRSDYLLISHYNTARLRLFDHAMGARSKTVGHSTPHSIDPAPYDFDTIGRLGETIKMAFEFMLSIPVCYFFYFPQPMTSVMLYTLSIMCRWSRMSSTKDPTLSEFLARPAQQIDIYGYLDRLAERLESAEREMKAAHGTWNNNKWNIGAYKVRAAKMTLSRLGDIVGVVGGEALLMRQYHTAALVAGVDESAEASAETNEPEKAIMPESDFMFSGLGEMQGGPGIFSGMDSNSSMLLDMFGDWGVNWMSAE